MSRYIDVEEVTRTIVKRAVESTMDLNTVGDIINIIQDFPTADVAPVMRGEWIYNKTSTLWECSNCHEEEIRSTAYCPHCGARNRGGR